MRKQPMFVGVMVMLILVATMLPGCATVAPGADPVLVNAERNLNIAVKSLDALFKSDYQNWQVIDPAIPSWKPAVNQLRVTAPPVIDAANALIKGYRAALALYRADPTQITQAQLNALATDLGKKIVEAVNLGKKALEIIQWFPIGTGGAK